MAHSVSGGVQSVINGGKFLRGFISAGFTKAVSPYIKDITNDAIVGSIIAGSIGGTASVIGGGKFGNAAATSAFAYMFNESATGKKNKGDDTWINDDLIDQKIANFGEDNKNINISKLLLMSINLENGALGNVCIICVVPAASSARFAYLGREITLSRNLRIAPFGNRTGHAIGKWPHYHRRVLDKITGEIKTGQGLKRHRPLEKKSSDTSIKDRF